MAIFGEKTDILHTRQHGILRPYCTIHNHAVTQHNTTHTHMTHDTHPQ